MDRDFYDLKEAARQEALDVDLDLYKDQDGEIDIGHAAHEIADGLVPVYTAELMRIGASEVELAVTEPDCGPAFDGRPTAVNILAAVLYERLQEIAIEVLQERVAS
jgi:hypothetical protein